MNLPRTGIEQIAPLPIFITLGKQNEDMRAKRDAAIIATMRRGLE
jgi:hypothetical protein